MCRAGGVNVGSRMRADDYRPLQGAKKRLFVPESLATVCDGITPPHRDSSVFGAPGQGDAEQVPAMARAMVWDGMQGASHSDGRSYREDLQRGRPPKAGMRGARGTCSALP
mgnify:CR=1 FL=1